MTLANDLGQRLGWAAIYILCLCAFLAPAGVAGGLALLALAFLLIAPGRADLLRDPVVLSSLAFALFLILHTAILATQHLMPAHQLWDAAMSWLQLLLFIPFGVLLTGHPHTTGRLFLLVLVSILLGMLVRMDWELLLASPASFFESRPGFGFPTIAFALYSGSVILGLVFLGSRWRTARSGPAATLGLGVSWLLCLLVLAQGFLVTQSRGAWIAFVVALAVGALLTRWTKRAQPTVKRIDQGRWLGLTGVGAVAVLLALNAGLMQKRLTTELDTASEVLQGQTIGVDPAAPSSVGLRWNAQLFGLGHWLERPWLGWGAGSSHRLMQRSQDPSLEQEGQTLSHLHNTYLETLVQFGILGMALLGLHVLLLMTRLWSAVRAGHCPPDYGVMLLTLFVFTWTWSLWSYRVVHQDWRVFWVILAGTALSFSLRPRAEAAGEASRDPQQGMASIESAGSTVSPAMGFPPTEQDASS